METMRAQDPSRRHTCAYCNRGFRKPEHLRRHTRIHTKEKPYRCHCGSSFSRRDLLLRHERLAHQSSQPPAVSSGTVVASAPAATTTGTGQDNLERQSITVALPVETPVTQPFANSVARSPLPIPRHTEDHPLYDFNNFLGNSSLAHLVNGPVTTDGAREHDAVYPVDTPQAVYSPAPTHVLRNPGARVVFSLSPTTANRETGVQLTDAIMSDPAMQQFIDLNASFSLLSSQTAERYLKSFFQHFKFPIVHPQYLQSDSLSAVLGLAVLGLGARYLLEEQKASMLFNASKNMAIKHWTSTQQSQSQNTHWFTAQLALTFLLLLEYVKLEQTRDFARDMSVLQSGLIFYSSIPWDDTSHSSGVENHFSQWVQNETKRRIQAFGLCALIMNAFLFDFLPTLSKPSLHLRLPCSPKAWACSTSEEFEQLKEGLQSAPTNHLLSWLDSNLSQADTATEPQIDSTALQFSHFVAALLCRRLGLMGDSWFSWPSTSSIDQERQLMAKTTTHYILALQNSQSSDEKPTSLMRATTALFRLLQVRLAFNLPLEDGLGSLYSKSPRQIARALYAFRGPRPVSPDILTSALHHSIDVLEEPSTTGIPFFVRSRTSCWDMEQLILTFESVLLLCKWLYHDSDTPLSSHDDAELLQRVRALLSLAWSSIDGANDLSPGLDAKDLAFVLVKFWAQVFNASENKPFVHQLGQSLSEFAEAIGHSDLLAK